MKKIITTLAVFVIALIFLPNNYAQSAGDYRSLINGDWSAAGTWEVFNGTTWDAAATAPDGSENITVDDTVTVDVAVSVTGYVTIEGDGLLTVGAGELTFADGSTYEHARNAGTIPDATWGMGSTCLITGLTGNSPGNANQDFYHFTWDNAGQGSNLNLAWSGNTIGGNLTVANSGSGRFQMSNNNAILDSITIEGDVIVTGGVLASNGSGGAATYDIYVNGNVDVTGGNFSLSRGSGGIANWYLAGDFSISNATIQTSNNLSKIVFIAYSDTQQVAFNTISRTGTINYEVDTAVTIEIADGPDDPDVSLNGRLLNKGDIIITGTIAFENNSIYQHDRNGGSIPVSTWEDGSTIEFTGIVGNSPSNGNQDFYNIIWNCPDQGGNLNLGWNGNTIGGDINIVSTGSGRWQMCAPTFGNSATVTILGDLIQEDGQFSSNGTGNGETTILIDQFGDVKVTGGNFSVSRGSQGNGSGTTTWNLYGDTISLANATTQNSNPFGAKFVIAGNTTQNLILDNMTLTSLPIEVDSNAILNLGTNQISGSGIFMVDSAATIETANEGGLDSALQNSGELTLSNEGNYTFNGTVAQITGSKLPDTVNVLTVNNSSGVTLSASVQVDGELNVDDGDLNLNGNTVTLGTSAMLNETPGNTVTGTSGKIITTRDIDAPSALNVGGLGAEITSAANFGSTIIERIHSAATGGGNEGIFRQFNISPANNSGLDATFRFHYDESELNSIPETNLILFKSPSGADDTWEPMAGAVNTDNNYVELSGISEFSYWTLGDIDNPVPVELTSFSAVVDGQNVNLKWMTATEVNNRGFEVEKKSGKEWEKIGFIEGNGNKLDASNYSFTDKNVKFGTFEYRLKQLDYDGRYDYSSVIEVVVSAPKTFTLHQNYPNPFNPETVIRFELPQESFVNISIYNSLGERVATIINEKMDIGVHSKTFNASSFTSGIYIYRLTTDNHVFTKKMMLIK